MVEATLACVETSPLPQEKSGEETPLPIFPKGGGTSGHRLKKSSFPSIGKLSTSRVYLSKKSVVLPQLIWRTRRMVLFLDFSKNF